MRVCVLIPVLDAYKGANHLPLFAALPDITFTIVCNRNKVATEVLPKNVDVVVIPGSIGPYYYGCADFCFARRVMRTFPPTHAFWQRFQVIHLNQVMGPALRALRRTGIPLLLFIHHPVTADRDVAVQETRGCTRIAWRWKYAALIRWQRRLCADATVVATVSQAMRCRIALDYGRDVVGIRVVPNGVASDIFVPRGETSPLQDVIAIGSFVHPRKGFGYLVEVYRTLAQQGWTIADVGRRTSEQLQILRSIPGVTIHGTVSGEKLVSLLQASRALVSTSLFEGFGLSLIEALSCGIPAFAFAGGAVGEVLGAIDERLIVPERDSAALAAHVDAFLSQQERSQRDRGAQYRSAVVHMYGMAKAAGELKKLYESMHA